jgi:hypothetical protein
MIQADKQAVLGKLLEPPMLSQEIVQGRRRTLFHYNRLTVSLMDAPRFRGLIHGRQMMFDNKVRIGLGVRDGFLALAEVDVDGPSEYVNNWIRGQWRKTWQIAAHKLLRTKRYGYRAFEVLGRKVKSGPYAGWVGIKELLDVPIRDVRALTAEGDTVGFRIHKKKLFAPKALWTTFNAEHGEPYPIGLLERAYPYWYQRWTYQGTEEMAALYMARHAAPGDVAFYPQDGAIEIPLDDGTYQLTPWRDVIAAAVEGKQSFSTLLLPRIYNDQGQPTTDYVAPTNPPSANPFEWYRNENDKMILESMGVFSEIVQAGETGSGFSGRSVPLMAMLAGFSEEIDSIVSEVDRQVLRPMCHLNLGRTPEYSIHAKSLMDIVSDDVRDSSMAGSSMGRNDRGKTNEEKQNLSSSNVTIEGSKPSDRPFPEISAGKTRPTNKKPVRFADEADERDQTAAAAMAKGSAILRRTKEQVLEEFKKKDSVAT